VTIGTQGIGFVAARPQSFITQVTDSTNANVVSSNSAYTAPNVNVGAAGVNYDATNSSYLEDSFQPTGANTQLAARIVARGLRIRYAGTELNKSGTQIGLEHPTHSTVNGLTFNHFAQYDKSVISPVSREWTAVTWQHKYPDETTYQETGFVKQRSAAAGETSFIDLAFILRGTPGNDYEYEYQEIWEFIGPAARGKQPAESQNNSAYDWIGRLQQLDSSDYTRIVRTGVHAYQYLSRTYNAQRRIVY